MAVKSPRLLDVIVRRITNLTGETAMLAATKRLFAAVAESRACPPTGLNVLTSLQYKQGPAIRAA